MQTLVLLAMLSLGNYTLANECPPGTELHHFWESPVEQSMASCWSNSVREERRFDCVEASNGNYPGNLTRGSCSGGYVNKNPPLRINCRLGITPVARMLGATYPEDPLFYLSHSGESFSFILEEGKELIFGNWKCPVEEGNWGCTYQPDFVPTHYLKHVGNKVTLNGVALQPGDHRISSHYCDLKF